MDGGGIADKGAAKSWAAALLAAGLIAIPVLVAAPASGAGRPALDAGAQTSSRAQLLRQLRADSVSPVSAEVDPQTKAPTFIRASIPVRVVGVEREATAGAKARAFMRRYRTFFGISSGRKALRALDASPRQEDPLGRQHVYLQQVERGVPVLDGSASVHLNESGTRIETIISTLATNLVAETDPAASPREALAAAREDMPGGQPVGRPRLAIVTGAERPNLDNSLGRLIWVVQLRQRHARGGPAGRRYLIDASSGAILLAADQTDDAGERFTYTWVPRSGQDFPLGRQIEREEGDSSTGDADVDLAHDHAALAREYFQSRHLWTSYDNRGSPIVSIARVEGPCPGPFCPPQENAGWSRDYHELWYSPGWSQADIVGHEFMHGVTQASADLEFGQQSLAIGEGLSDVFGAAVEAMSADSDPWYLFGEDLPSSVLGGARALRNIADPTDPTVSRPGIAQMADWSCRVGVHAAGGIVSRAFYLTASDAGRVKAEDIFFRALRHYLPRSYATFSELRAATLAAASDLYGEVSLERASVWKAWSSVGVDASSTSQQCYWLGKPPPPKGTQLLRPYFDAAHQWREIVDGRRMVDWPASMVLDDPVVQPSPVGRRDYIDSTRPNQVTKVWIESVTLSGATPRSGRAWFFARTGRRTRLEVAMIWNGSVRRSRTIGEGKGFAWRSLAGLPSDQRAVDTLQLRFKTLRGGDAKVRAAYVALGF